MRKKSGRPLVAPSIRFWDKVEKSDGCWTWTAAKIRTGYGRFSIGVGNHVYAHRFAYEDLVGPIPDGLTLDHLCKNRACVNPKHLEPVSLRDNILRGDSPSAAHARKTHCPEGHPYEGNNLLRSGGSRRCRICHNRQSMECHNRRKRE